jgi:hypothetical protein
LGGIKRGAFLFILLDAKLLFGQLLFLQLFSFDPGLNGSL